MSASNRGGERDKVKFRWNQFHNLISLPSHGLYKLQGGNKTKTSKEIKALLPIFNHVPELGVHLRNLPELMSRHNACFSSDSLLDDFDSILLLPVGPRLYHTE